MKILSFLCLIATLVVADADVAVETVRTKIELGNVLGSVRDFRGKRYSSFAGIRYAEPPIGPLRFLPPEPYRKPWEGDLVNLPI